MYAIIDIETTGGNAKTGKITEIAIYVHNGERIIDEFTSLINPETSIPPFIAQLTGISNEMVENAPLFADVAEEIFSKTANTIFVAHNVNFDYSFIREEYRKLGYDFNRKRLCTVQLSRKSFPGLKSYSLGKLTSELNIVMESHHRAAVDAFATVKLFEMILEREKQHGLFDAHYGIPDLEGIEGPFINEESIEQLPDETGVFYFLDAEDRYLYAQKSSQIKETVINKLKQNAAKSMQQFRNEIYRMDYIVTGSNLLAQLIEIEEIKTKRPIYNFGKNSLKMRFAINVKKSADGLLVYIGKSYSMDENLAFYSTLNETLKAFETLICVYNSESENIAGKKSIMVNPVDLDNIKQFLNLQKKTLIITDEGRNAGERTLILIKGGEIKGYLFADFAESIQDLSELEDKLIPLNNSLEMKMAVRQSIEKKNCESLIYLK